MLEKKEIRKLSTDTIQQIVNHLRTREGSGHLMGVFASALRNAKKED